MPNESVQWYPIWVDYLPQAIEDCQAGFHFEEGGCFGFALAASKYLARSGMETVELALRTDCCHAYAKIGELLIDHQGAWLQTKPVRSTDEEGLRAYALESGHTREDLSSDESWASQTIERAISLAHQAVPWPLNSSPTGIANHIAQTSPQYVDTELIQEHFFGASMCLGMALIASVSQGPAESNIPCAEKQRTYAALTPDTRPPIVIDAGIVMDGNHRLRDAITRGESFILSYVAVDNETDTTALKDLPRDNAPHPRS